MKIRIQIPSDISKGYKNSAKVNQYIDDILLWGMETEIDVALYKTYMVSNSDRWVDGDLFAVFTVEPVGAMMFTLRWGALQHKNKQKDK